MRFLGIAAGSLFALASADGTYRTRPDLSPPQLNITVPCSAECAEGFLFVSPFTSYNGPSDYISFQPAPYILTDTGDLVWSGFTYFSIWAGNFQAARWKGRDVLFSFEGAHNGLHGHGHGHHTFLNQDYDNIRELRAGNHMLSDKHEFIVLNERTALIQIYHPVQIDLTPYGGVAGQSWIVDARFQELDIETGEVLFEWHSLDHCSPEETALPLSLGQAGMGYNSTTAWDYFHINSITKGGDGHYLLSARHASTVLKINGTDGSVIWRFGGHRSDFTIGPNVTFGFQHHARYLPGGNDTHDIISLFDNSVYGSESAGGGDKEVRLHPFSQGKYIALDHAAKTATLVKAFHPPVDSILAKSQGSLQTLPNYNVLINWGSEGQLTEYTPEGEVLFHAFLSGGFLQDKVQNYRAFRYNWTGYSSETPAILAERDDEGVIKFYVSWNGDTETRTWRFTWAEVDREGALARKEKEVARTGFETVCCIGRRDWHISMVRAVAVDGEGKVLAVSGPVEVDQALGRAKGKPGMVFQQAALKL